jgi:hypothetical protein
MGVFVFIRRFLCMRCVRFWCRHLCLFDRGGLVLLFCPFFFFIDYCRKRDVGMMFRSRLGKVVTIAYL